MLILNSENVNPAVLAFSPDGLSLLAAGDSRVQVWPRWLDAPPRPTKKVQTTLERCAFSEDASRVYLYVSGNSYTRVLDVARGAESTTQLPTGGPSWFHFDTDGGYFLVSHNRGQLSRFDHAPKLKKSVRKAWSIKRKAEEDEYGADGALGSHYRFGAICGTAGLFVALEYHYGGDEPIDALTVRSVDNGRIVHRQEISGADGQMLLRYAGLKLHIHPSGTYFAFPRRKQVQLWPLADDVQVPKSLALPPGGIGHAVAFHPSGTLLAAAGGDGAVKLYDTTTWELTRTLAWGIGALRAVCFSPDGTRGAAITGGSKKSERRIVVWDVDL